MGGKHLKRLRAEKAKVKLRKKNLPKGQNITDTTFKVKKIVTLEQLKKVENEPVTSWNLPLKDLLVRLGHYNLTSKLNSLSGIKELVTNHPDILKGPSLKQLITRVLDLLNDEEPKARKTAIALIEYLFERLPAASIIPFQDILNVHLGCAMTNRNSFIQKDSLMFIDILINYIPQAVRLNFKSILLNYIRMIKSHLNRSHSELSSVGRNLERSRSELLLRFYNFLAAVYLVQKDEPEIIRNIYVNNKNNNQISMRELTNFYKKTPDLSGLFKNDDAEKGIFLKFDPEEYKQQCQLIMPLIFDSWLESCPDQTSEKSVAECLISKSAGELLHVILKILILLYDKAATSGHQNLESWFVLNYSQNFKKCFLFNFPYLPSVSSVKPDESLPSEDVQKFSGYLIQNLMVCYLTYSLKAIQSNALLNKMDDYISSALTTRNHTAVVILSKVIEVVLKSCRRSVLSAATAAFNESSSPELRETLSRVLTKIVVGNEDMGNNNKDLLEWMNLLPEQLLKPCVPLPIIESILISIKRPTGALLLENVEQKAQDILKNLANVRIEGVDQLQGQKLIADVLYWCDEETLIKIQNILSETDTFPPDLKSYMMNIFSYKLSR